jgi:hypothetical protein
MTIDVQDCFMEAGGTSSCEDLSLAVQDTAEIVPNINSIRSEKSCLFNVVVRSQAYHTVNLISFGPTHGLEPFAHLAGFFYVDRPGLWLHARRQLLPNLMHCALRLSHRTMS